MPVSALIFFLVNNKIQTWVISMISVWLGDIWCLCQVITILQLFLDQQLEKKNLRITSDEQQETR